MDGLGPFTERAFSILLPTLSLPIQPVDERFASGYCFHDLKSQSVQVNADSYPPFHFSASAVSALAGILHAAVSCNGGIMHTSLPVDTLVASSRWASLIRASRFAGLRIVTT